MRTLTATCAALAALLLVMATPVRGQVLLFGNSVDLGANSGHSRNFLLGSAITVSTAGVLQDAGIIFRGTGSQGKVALYDSTVGGLPGQLVASTAAFTVTSSGVNLIPFTTTPVLNPGTYWFMAVYDITTSVGFSSAGSPLVAYNSFNFGAPLPTTFGAPTTYTGQSFNYYLQVQAIPEPPVIALEVAGILVLMLYDNRRHG